jgi:membrane protein YfhO
VSRARTLALAVLVAVPWWLRLATPVDPTGLRTADLRTYFYPSYEAFFGALAHGRWLGWNPYQACGLPWLGTLQTGFFYPPHVLYLVLPTHAALFVSQLLHVLLAALATIAFLGRLGVALVPAALGALLFVCYGSFASWLAWPYLLEASAWLPLGCIAVYDLATAPGPRPAALAATALGMSWLAGGPQATVFLLYAWGTLFVVLVVASGRRSRLPAVVGMTAAIVLGTLAGMAALLPARELAAEGVRATTTLEAGRMFPAGVGAPDVWSVVAIGGRAGFPALAWALAPLAALAHGRRAVAAWCAGTIATTALITTGPVHPWIFAVYGALPALAWFRAPGRILLLAGFGGGVLAAIGADVVVARARAAQPSVAAVVGGALVAVAIAGITPLPGALPYDAAAAAGYREHAAVYERLARLAGDGRVWLASDWTPMSTPARLATVHRVRSVLDYEPLLLRRQVEYFEALFGQDGPLAWPRMVRDTPDRMRLLDLAAVRYAVVPATRRSRLVAPGGMRPVDVGDDGLQVLERPSALPRAYVAYRTAPAPAPSALLALLRRPAFDPLGVTYVEDGPIVGGPESPAGHAATITVDEPERVDVEAELAARGVVVLADTFARGWSATVDDRPVAIAPANHLFRAVEVPAGRHVVQFVYHQPGLVVGLATSLAAWVAIAALWKLPPGGRHPIPDPHEDPARDG